MAKVVWAKDALQQLNDIAEYISKDSVVYAQKQVELIYQRSKLLEVYPMSGRVVPEWEDELVRELIVGNYRLIYKRVTEVDVLIVAVHHGKMKMGDRDQLK